MNLRIVERCSVCRRYAFLVLRGSEVDSQVSVLGLGGAVPLALRPKCGKVFQKESVEC